MGRSALNVGRALAALMCARDALGLSKLVSITRKQADTLHKTSLLNLFGKGGYLFLAVWRYDSTQTFLILHIVICLYQGPPGI